MMFLGIIIFLIGLFLVFDCNNRVTNSLPGCCKREDRALNILKERYARGEISTDEYNTMRNVLSDSSLS